MRPALDRLLARPSSLRLLRSLIEAPNLHAAIPTQCRRRNACTLASPLGDLGHAVNHNQPEPPKKRTRPHNPKASRTFCSAGDEKALLEFINSQRPRREGDRHNASPHDIAKRVVDIIDSSNQKALDVWQRMKDGGISVSRSKSAKLSKIDHVWIMLLRVGLRQPDLIEDIHEYIDDRHSRSEWLELYRAAIAYLLENGHGTEAIQLHDKMAALSLPDIRTGGAVMRDVIFSPSNNADIEALKEIYIRAGHRSLYGQFIPDLCSRKMYSEAYEWHQFLIRYSDVPSTKNQILPLLQHFSRTDAEKADRIMADLTLSRSELFSSFNAVGANHKLAKQVRSFAGEGLLDVEKLGGQDKWMAQLFATRWISLSASLATVHAAGVGELGPLSLQALAQRAQTVEAIDTQLSRLDNYGIGITTSAYGRALSSFSKQKNQLLIDSLLESDQHPSCYDDADLQRQLIKAARTSKDWAAFDFLTSMQLASSVNPMAETCNVRLKQAGRDRDHVALMKTLEEMRLNRIPVRVSSIMDLEDTILKPRRKGHRPDQTVEGYVRADNDFYISVLKSIMSYGGFVPVTAWREVTKRLGMVGRIDDLFSLSMFLVDAYMPKRGLKSPVPSDTFHSELPPDHELHPIRIHFGDIHQRSIVEWCIMHGLNSYAAQIRDGMELARMTPTHKLKEDFCRKIRPGMDFLKVLRERGVYIKDSNIRRAFYTRMVILYGPGLSNRVFNRRQIPYNPLSLDEMVSLVHTTWGKTFWPSVKVLEGDIRKEADAMPMLPGPKSQYEVDIWKEKEKPI